jgi:glycosyltransferase involved in cell wall biosynthesis
MCSSAVFYETHNRTQFGLPLRILLFPLMVDEMKKKLLIDVSSAQPTKLAAVNGGGRYAFNIFREILARKFDADIEVLLDGRKGESPDISTLLASENIPCHYFQRVEDMGKVIDDISPDLVFFPVCYPEYGRTSFNRNIKVVAVIHDLSTIYDDRTGMIRERYLASPRQIFRQLVRRVPLRPVVVLKHLQDHRKIVRLSDYESVVTVSEYSREQIKKYTGFSGDIPVLYPKVFSRSLPLSGDDTLKEYGLERGKYYLMTSANRWHKNNYFAVSAIDGAIREGRSGFGKYKYVISGIDEEHAAFYRKHITNPENFVFIEYSRDEFYYTLMKYARAFIYPSLYEGFGAPPVEAMGLGTAVISSDSTCLGEIYADAALYFNPRNKSELISAVEDSFSDEVLSSLEEKGRKRFDYIYARQQTDTDRLMELLKSRL